MDYPWYGNVPATADVTQGDLFRQCPISGWRDRPVDVDGSGLPDEDSLEGLAGWQEDYRFDVVVLTQACDLSERHVADVVVCPFERMGLYKKRWEDAMNAKIQRPSKNAWAREEREIINGQKWHLTALLGPPWPDGGEDLVVDFRRIYSLPRVFLESWARMQGSRTRLLPPYREHLSQSFARFFMRVGLPSALR